MQLEVKLADHVDPFAITETTKDNDFIVAIEAGRVLINAQG